MPGTNFLVIGHRGASDYCPENTLTSFKVAEAMNADGIELDVRLSADKVPVVIHDSFVNRLANGSGAVNKKTLRELRQLKIAPSERIPTLAEAVEATHIKLFVEIKETENTSLILKELEKHKQRVVIVSYFDHVVEIAKKAGFKIGIVSFSTLSAVKRAEKLNADYILCFKALVTKKFALQCKQRRLKLIVWVVNSAKSALWFKQNGVHGIITDYPDILKSSQC